MKIVDLNTFLTLPEGTLFAKYEPCIFSELKIKGESLAQDFFYCDLTAPVKYPTDHAYFSILKAAQYAGSELDLDFYNKSRDGLFDKGQLFAVYSKEDTQQLIKRLLQALPD